MITYDTFPPDEVFVGNIVPGLLPSIAWPPQFSPPVNLSLMEPSIRQWAFEFWLSRCLAPKWDWLFPRDIGNIRLVVRRVGSRVSWDRIWSWLLNDDDVIGTSGTER